MIYTTDDAESQATTNEHTVDESGDSESGGHNEPGWVQAKKKSNKGQLDIDNRKHSLDLCL